jgi:competence protein ComEA
LNEAMPPWRTFSSDVRDRPDGAAAPATPGASTREAGRWLVPLLAGLGGAAAAVAVALLAAVVVLTGPPLEDTPPAFGEPLDAGPAAGDGILPSAGEAPPIMVDVAGAVVRPGLHRLRAGQRVGDAIEAAGGFAAHTDLAAAGQLLNLAQPLEDGAKVLVPELGLERAGAAADGRVDLNRAERAELESLPGIGPVTAGRIIAAREERRFGSARDLRTRGLVSESVFEGLEGLVRAG